ncbi:MAG: glycosyl hydrolases family 31-domain-containing protein [Benjaminiella poitrasii]|nr:MAG: glycosyl hydrolases family 31-domain-containing protein [Benjaminiella poitrasii]
MRQKTAEGFYLTASEVLEEQENIDTATEFNKKQKYSNYTSCLNKIENKTDDSSLEIETPTLRLVVTLKPSFCLSWFSASSSSDSKDRLFAQDLAYRSYSYDKHANDKWHYQQKFSQRFYYGLGERSGSLNLTGRRFCLDRIDCMGYDAETSDPLYKFCPFYISLCPESKEAYGVYYNNFSRTTVNFGQEIDAMWGPYTYYHSQSNPLDYYMIYGPAVSSVIHRYSFITGRPKHLPPRYSLGYLASSMRYAEVDDAQAKILEFAKRCREEKIPCDGIHLSSGYTVDENGNRCVFTWNPSRFPDPVQLASQLDKLGFKIFANVKPWLLHDFHPDFEQLRKIKGLVWDDDENGPSTIMQWREGPHTMGKASYIDFSSREGYDYWKKNVKTKLLDKGYLLWLDNNEFTLADDGHTFACQISPQGYSNLLASADNPYISGPAIPNNKKSTAKKTGSSLQTLLMVQASYEALLEKNPKQRPFLITRSATPYCNQLVSQTWSGDNTTAWNTIKYNIPMGLSACLSGMPAGYGHDIGGFSGPKPSPEMLVRWVQQGVFWPRFCIHSLNSDGSITEPWMYPEVTSTIRSSINFRYKLIPYLYTLYVTYAFQRGEPLIIPVFYHHQHDARTFKQEFDFMLGPSLLIAPVYEPNLQTRDVYLPSGTAWYHYQTGMYYNSLNSQDGQWIQVPALITDDTAPFFVKAGSAICFGKVMNHVHDAFDDERRVQIFPERFDDKSTKRVNGKTERKTFVLFEDDGDTLYHETGQAYAEIHIWMETTESEIHVGLDIVQDGFFPYYDTIWVTCPIASETRKLVFEDEETVFNSSDDIHTTNPRRLPTIIDNDTLHVYTGLKLRMKKRDQKGSED